ncbi:MAG TPA: serine/threonine protein kinase, partial [Marinobacter sp.]|nr:serine/threonine protein kinase [Marinobacter sp.]
MLILTAVVFVMAGDQLAFLSWADRVLFSFLGGSELSGAAIPDSAEALRRALADRGLTESVWVDLYMAAGFCVAVLYLIFALPKMGVAVALPVTLLFGGCLVVLQAALVFYRKEWLPLGEILSLLVIGFVVMLYWLQPHRQIQALTANVREARLRLASLLLKQGDTD